MDHDYNLPIPILKITNCQYALDSPIRNKLTLNRITPIANKVCLPKYRDFPAILSAVSPVKRLQTEKTVMKAVPAKIWYGNPDPA